MDHYPGFPFKTSRGKKVPRRFYDLESEFMPALNFFDDPENSEMRTSATASLAQYSQGRNFDVYTHYLAMNYFDRFVSRNPLPDIQGDRDRKVFVTAICCLTIAAKMRNITFRVKQFVKDVNLNTPLKTIAKAILSILKGLGWRMCPITPFSFVDHYYHRYIELGGFRRLSIIEIIIQAQGDNHFTRFKHSEIASSSLIAATAIAYPTEFLTHFLGEVEKAPGLCELIYLCGSKQIGIERAESRLVATSSTPEGTPIDDEAIPRRPGKEVASTSQVAPPGPVQGLLSFRQFEGEASTSGTAPSPAATVKEERRRAKLAAAAAAASTENTKRALRIGP